MDVKKYLLFTVAFLLLLGCTYQKSEPANTDYEKDIKSYSENGQIIFDVINIRGRPSIKNYWTEMPKFTFCKESRLTNQRARNGIRFWRRIGYNITDVRYSVSDQECFRDPENGEVMVKLVTSDTPIRNNLAVTSVYFRPDNNQIQYAIIYLIGGFANDERLIEHEIGHALGWSHYGRVRHIMNSDYSQTGTDNYGLSFSVYQQQVLMLEE